MYRLKSNEETTRLFDEEEQQKEQELKNLKKQVNTLVKSNKKLAMMLIKKMYNK